MNLAERLNRECDCSFTDLPALQRQFNLDLALTHRHLISDAPVFIDAQQAHEMQRIIAAIETVVGQLAYQRMTLAHAPPIARAAQPALGVFMAFDFHLSPDGPRLVEINTNAGGAFVNATARSAQRECCDGADLCQASPPGARDPLHEIRDMFANEWRLARGGAPLQSIAIVDEHPQQQYLYPEFRLAQKLFASMGLRACIVDPAELEIVGEQVYARGGRIDLIYNRLTDFYFAHPRNHVLQTAYQNGLAVITPHPHAHALYSDKRNLALLSDVGTLTEIGVPEESIALLLRGIPRTRVVEGPAEGWWSDRKRWFFKPRHGFGSRGGYRGDGLTRRVFAEVMRGGYVAQEMIMPSERWRSTRAGRRAFKIDVRCYAYAGKIQLIAVRLYQGQTTNFRTEGGGFAPVYLTGGGADYSGATQELIDMVEALPTEVPISDG